MCTITIERCYLFRDAIVGTYNLWLRLAYRVGKMQKPQVSQSGKKERIQHGAIWGLKPPCSPLVVINEKIGEEEEGVK